MAKASDFNFGIQLGFAHHKIAPRRKVSITLGYGSSQIFGVQFNISSKAEGNYFKFGIELGFAKSNYKITPKGKGGRNRCPRRSQNLGVSL